MFKVQEDGQFRGTVTFLDARLQPGAVGNDEVAAAAGLASSKLDHVFEGLYAQESATACADEARVIHAARAAGNVRDFSAGSVVANIGAAVVDIDLLKGGVSILVAKIQLTAAHAAYEIVEGTVDTAAYVAEDVFEVDIDGTAGGGTLAKGVFAFGSFDEAYT